MKQNTQEWTQARVGYVTASRFPTIKYEGGRLTGTAEGYLYELIGEHMTGHPADTIQSKPMAWGSKHEAEARSTYILETGKDVAEKGFHKHPTEEWIGCSPDGGLIEEDGLIEIKCPWQTREHIKSVSTGKVPAIYMDQIMGQLWVTGRSWCDFVSYDPRVQGKSRLLVLRVDRDEECIEDLAERITKFRNLMISKLDKIK
tara:strand:- start:159 stop:761 length:603 start_codon:yes stop_codon:yes gene_type:complete